MNTRTPCRARPGGWAMLACALFLGACNTLPTVPEGQSANAVPGSTEPTLDNRPTHVSLVRQMQGNGLWFASLAHIDALEQRWGVASETRLLRAEALRQTGQPAAATALYEQLLATPERAAAFRGLGLLAGSQGDYARAASLFENARQLQPTDGLLLNDLGYALLMDRHAERARLPLMQASQLLPTHPRVRSNLALWLLVQGQADAARQLMDDARFSTSTRQAIEQLAQELAPTGPGTQVAGGGLLLRHSLRLSQALAAGNGPAP